MLYNFILLQFAAHLLADFTFQPQKWSLKKAEKVLTKYHLFHALVVYVFSFVLSFTPHFWWGALMIALLHLIIDVLKSLLIKRAVNNGHNRNYFFADQIVHIAILLGVSYLYFDGFQVKPLCIVPHKLAIVFAGYLFCSKPSNLLIKHIFDYYSIEIDENTEEKDVEGGLPNAGKLIGTMERFIVLALIWVGQFGAVGLIIAAKSILRFQSNSKNEYVLVGTLLSFGIAFMVGIGMVQLSKIITGM